MLSGLAQLSIELTSRCDKRHLCKFCGHQDETVHPHLEFGDMDFELLRSIRAQVEPGVVISFHRDGEPSAYPLLAEALDLFRGFTTSLVTHGLSLVRKRDAIIGRCTTVTVSVFRGDPDRDEQLAALRQFCEAKKEAPPQVQVKIVGDMTEDEIQPYAATGARLIRRLIHVPIHNAKYAHRAPTIPEGGVCLDALHRPTIDWCGDFFLCNRLDPDRHGYLGSVREHTVDELWNGARRQAMVAAHQRGRRDLASPLCKDCTFWGIASEA